MAETIIWGKSEKGGGLFAGIRKIPRLFPHLKKVD
jgi:hypothetical protein